MMQADKARAFADLHVAGSPVILYNIWDAGGAKALAKAGAQAIATGSWSVAAAQGYRDGEAIPMEMLLQIITRITATCDVPVTVDFEGGYAKEPAAVAANVVRLMETGAIGLNFEDQVVGGDGLHGLELQVQRIGAIRKAVDFSVFINARTDLFLKEPDVSKHAGLMAEAEERASAYAQAGASGFFAPGLTDPDLIARLCETCLVPVNVMVMKGAPSPSELAGLGVARISHGPGPYFDATAALTARFKESAG